MASHKGSEATIEMYLDLSHAFTKAFYASTWGDGGIHYYF